MEPVPEIAKPQSAKLMFCSHQSRATDQVALGRKRQRFSNRFQSKSSRASCYRRSSSPGTGDVLSLRFLGRAGWCWWDGRPQRTDAAAVRGRFPSQLHSSGREGEEAIDRAGVHGGCISPVYQGAPALIVSIKWQGAPVKVYQGAHVKVYQAPLIVPTKVHH